jgi:hypothetical protein
MLHTVGHTIFVWSMWSMSSPSAGRRLLGGPSDRAEFTCGAWQATILVPGEPRRARHSDLGQ